MTTAPAPIPTVHPRTLARARDENFHVLSRFVPVALRDDFAAVYAFCRGADDLADEHAHTDASRAAVLAELAQWRALLDAAAAFALGERDDPPDHPVFAPLAHTMRRRSLDAEPFHDLLSAFEQDQRVACYETWEELLDYCARSASPVGRIVLAMIDPPLPHRGRGEGEGPDDPTAALLMSDAVCTALQLTNFWQDVRRDLLEKGRVYLPRAETGFDAETLRRWAVSPDDSSARVAFITALRPLVQRTRELFAQGHALPAMIHDRNLARVVSLFILGGERTLDRIDRAGCATLWRRPTLTKFDKARLMIRARVQSRPRPANGVSPFVQHALRACAKTTRREARNFYYGLRLTPEPRRSALYAVYAWMRDADDDADGQDRAPPTRDIALARLERRRSRLRALVEHGRLDTARHPWVGLAWAMRRYPIEPADFFSLLAGLEADANHAGLETRDDLRAYCERVASTVGRVCVAIWGAGGAGEAHGEADSIREKATARGVAFQLTNILRDVRRDADAGRVYLPRVELARFGVSAHDVAHWKSPVECEGLIRECCAWARREFAASDGLERMIDPACAPSMRAMTEIYSWLLSIIEANPRVVSSPWGASLPTSRKVAIMARAACAARFGRSSR